MLHHGVAHLSFQIYYPPTLAFGEFRKRRYQWSAVQSDTFPDWVLAAGRRRHVRFWGYFGVSRWVSANEHSIYGLLSWGHKTWSRYNGVFSDCHPRAVGWGKREECAQNNNNTATRWMYDVEQILSTLPYLTLPCLILPCLILLYSKSLR